MRSPPSTGPSVICSFTVIFNNFLLEITNNNEGGNSHQMGQHKD